MARLGLLLLGTFGAVLDDAPITSFESNKVRALIAYLAVESDQPHRRESLAGLLWPEMPDRAALSNLRYALSNLRQSIGDREADPPFLLVTRDSIRFNSDSDHTLDTAMLMDAVAAHEVDADEAGRLATSLSLYRGPFLEGFSVSGSAPFEEWVLFKREQIGRQAMWAFRALAGDSERRGEFTRACAYARRQIELEPWDEEAHRQLMRCLALSGQRNAALRQYTVCRRQLARELGVEPAQETSDLYKSIRSAPGGHSQAQVNSRPDAAVGAGEPVHLTSEQAHAMDGEGEGGLPQALPVADESAIAGRDSLPALDLAVATADLQSDGRRTRVALFLAVSWAVVATVAAVAQWLQARPAVP